MASSRKVWIMIGSAAGFAAAMIGVAFLVMAYQGRTAANKRVANDIEQIAFAYFLHDDTFKTGPSTVEDLGPYVENNRRLMKLVESGNIVLIFNVKLADLKPDPGSYVLGYYKYVPEKGGHVIMGDGKVVSMTADEFKNAKIAKPSDKKDNK